MATNKKKSGNKAVKKKSIIKNGEKTQFTKENASLMGKKGGILSGESKRNWKSLKDIAIEALHNPDFKIMEKEALKKIIPEAINEEEITNGVAMIFRQIQKAIYKGDIVAFSALQAAAGEKPVDKIETKDTTPLNLTKIKDKELEKLIAKLQDDNK